jgi:RNA polymerase primary sigma factor
MSHRRTEAAITARGRGVSLEAPIGEDEGQTLYERIPDPGAAPDEDFVERETAQLVRDAIDGLEPRDAEVVNLTFGFHGEPLTLSEAGEHFGISKERVRQIRNRAVKQLRDKLVGDAEGAERILQELLS